MVVTADAIRRTGEVLQKCSSFNGTGDAIPNQDLGENLSLSWPPLKLVGTCSRMISFSCAEISIRV